MRATVSEMFCIASDGHKYGSDLRPRYKKIQCQNDKGGSQTGARVRPLLVKGETRPRLLVIEISTSALACLLFKKHIAGVEIRALQNTIMRWGSSKIVDQSLSSFSSVT